VSLSAIIAICVCIQVLSFLALCPLLWATGAWNLAAAQGLLALVTLFVYWPWA
jgi:hypothetical protein